MYKNAQAIFGIFCLGFVAAEPFGFGLTTGQHTIVFDVDGKKELILKVNVK